MRDILVGWSLIQIDGESFTTVHAVPINDLVPHTTTVLACHCDPLIQWEGGGVMVIHRSYDWREYEEHIAVTA